MKLRDKKSVSRKVLETDISSDEFDVQTDISSDEFDVQTDISSDEFDVPQTSRKRKKSSSCNQQENRSKKAKTSNLSNKIDKYADGVGTSGTVRNNVGVVKRKSGNFGVKIHDRIRKKDVWLGTFCSAEEASKVYWAKKEELEKEFEILAKNIVRVEETKKTSEFVGVSRRASGKFAAHIRDPIRKKKLYLGAFDSEEEASKVYLAKKEELQKEVKEGKTGARWYLGRREFRKPGSLIIRKRRNFGGETRKRSKVCEEIEWFEDDCIDPCSDEQESSMEIDDFESSSDESESSDKGISEEENDDEDTCSDDAQLSSRKFVHSDSLDGGNATNKDGIPESPILKEENGEPCSDNQESSKEELNHVVTSQKEAVPMDDRVPEQDSLIQKNGVKDESLIIRKRRNFGGETRKRSKVCEEIEWFEDDCSYPCSDEQESSMEIDDFEYSSDESESSDEGISEEENDGEDTCSEEAQLSSRKFDHSDSLDGGNATNKDGIPESPILKEENGEPCSDNQESSKEELNHVVTSQKETVPMDDGVPEQDSLIQKNGVKDELIVVDSSVQAPVNPGKCSNTNVLLRTNSGTPLMDSNGFLLGEWSWIDDHSLKINE